MRPHSRKRSVLSSSQESWGENDGNERGGRRKRIYRELRKRERWRKLQKHEENATEISRREKKDREYIFTRNKSYKILRLF
jgi:hypothetical protein